MNGPATEKTDMINRGGKSGLARRAAYLGVLTALCFGLSYLEMLVPITAGGIPGIKLGLANLCVMAALWLFGAKEAAAVSLIRILLSWLIFGSFTGLLYSLAGGALSFIGMILLKKTGIFSPVGISAAAGVLHNIGQLAVAAFLTDAGAIWYYLPVLIVSGAAAGTLNGIILVAVLKALSGRQNKNEQ